MKFYGYATIIAMEIAIKSVTNKKFAKYKSKCTFCIYDLISYNLCIGFNQLNGLLFLR